MALTSTTFLVNYPEFANAGTTLIAAHITAQDVVVSDSWAADERDDIVALKVADALATSASGRNARMDDPSKATTYAIALRKREEIHACIRNRVL